MTIEITRLGALEISDAQLEAAAQRAHIGPTQLQSPLCHHIDDRMLEGAATVSAGPTHTTNPNCCGIHFAPALEDSALESATRMVAGPTQLHTPMCHMIEDNVLEGAGLSANTTEVGCFTRIGPMCRRIDDGAAEAADVSAAPAPTMFLPYCDGSRH